MKANILTIILFLISPGIVNAQVETDSLILYFPKIDSLIKMQEKFEKRLDILQEEKADIKSPYRVNIGANLDFIDGIKTNSNYTKLGFFIRDMWKNENVDGNEINQARDKLKDNAISSPGILNWLKILLPNGVAGGIFQGKTFADKDTSTFFSSIDLYSTIDSVLHRTVLTRKTKSTTEITTKNLGIYFSLVKKIGKQIYLLGHSELRRDEVTTKTQFEHEIIDTLGTIPVSNFNVFAEGDAVFINPFSGLSALEVPSEIIRSSEIETFFGLGLMLDSRGKEVDLMVKAIRMLHSSDSIEQRTSYLVQFGLIANDIGVQIGGEIRGRNNSDPNISLHMSKVFSLSKLIDILKN
ncbi:MAG: hypothetical protein IIB94_01425 [Candidatus Marinimicrobia bacterium]|nr:hypothetical protein [Candidatus Neomarinimicrobiota bacterium]